MLCSCSLCNRERDKKTEKKKHTENKQRRSWTSEQINKLHYKKSSSEERQKQWASGVCARGTSSPMFGFSWRLFMLDWYKVYVLGRFFCISIVQKEQISFFAPQHFRASKNQRERESRNTAQTDRDTKAHSTIQIHYWRGFIGIHHFISLIVLVGVLFEQEKKEHYVAE